MCGIAGIYNTNQDRESLVQLAQVMISQLKHRGPDGNSFQIFDQLNQNKTLFVHTRLSIIDLSQAAKQPMKDKKGSLWITFNGEIYNHAEIRQELKSMGSTFFSNSDTEVILEAYSVWGMSCFERFIGMWALAIWDDNNQKFILSRDRLGIKPLYYSIKNHSIYFSSEPKVIVDQLPETKRLNYKAISDYFSYRYALGGDSFFSNIHSLEAGTHLIVTKGKTEKIRYWDLPVEDNKVDINQNALKEELTNILDSSVRYRMISDVPFGSFLSGGLDSSILVSIMSKIQQDPIRTYTIGFNEDGYNEFEYAKQVADQLKTEHKETTLEANSYLEAMETMIRIKDAPLAVPNEIALHKLSKVLKKDITVVLSGEGADELFGGYGRIFRSSYDYERLSSKEPLSIELQENLQKKYNNLEISSEIEHFIGQYSYFDEKEKLSLFSKDLLKEVDQDINNLSFFTKLWEPLEGLELPEKMMWIFQKVHLEGLLGRLDSATMSASVEGRVPFVDHRLVEYVNKVPLKYKIRWKGDKQRKAASQLNSDQISENLDITKFILREAYKDDLPNSISARKKIGFPVPLQSWLSGPLKSYAIKQLLDKNSRTEYLFDRSAVKVALDGAGNDIRSGLKAWMMLNVEEWMRIYDVSA